MYRLQRYYWRSLLTLIGPLLALAFYIFICLYFLQNPPQNLVVSFDPANARWFFFVWVIATIFMLDLSRTGLANIEAAALMHRRLAPVDANKLMWHVDSKWANPLWWLRACRAAVQVWFKPKTSTPGALWTTLSVTTLMIFIGLPLSGLSIELANVSAPTKNLTTIYGPSPETFNHRARLSLPQQIRARWQSGRVTAPFNDGILYAPRGTPNVTMDYFHDRASEYASSIEVFAGPAVRDPVSGRAWGVRANIACNPIVKDQFRALRVGNFTFEANSCVFYGRNTSCDLEWNSNVTRLNEQAVGGERVVFPLILDEKGPVQQVPAFSFVAVADGFSLSTSTAIIAPYNQLSNHDGMTLDSLVGQRPDEEVTTAMLELYFWETDAYRGSMMAEIAEGGYDDPIDLYNYSYWKGPKHKMAAVAGMGVRCEITSQVGSAQLDPGERTFSSFTRNNSIKEEIGMAPYPGYESVPPPQILALMALSSPPSSSSSSSSSSLDPDGGFVGNVEPMNSPLQWLDLHHAIGSAASTIEESAEFYITSLNVYKALRPKDLQLALYKLLGESVIAIMDEGGNQPWSGELYDLKHTRYIVSGLVPWPAVLVFLSLWALCMSGGAFWTILFARPRWAPTLGGFEMFRFGAQYAEEVDDFATVDPRGCSDALRRIPGMVGMLPGTGGATDPPKKLGFVGLSESVTSERAEYTFRRRDAALTRPW